MGFETQEEAERWYEAAEMRAEQLKDEAMFQTPRERAWKQITLLDAYKDMSQAAKELQRAVFDFAWDAAMRSNP